MGWKTEAVTRVCRTRLQANNLRHSIGGLEYGLHSLGSYDDECALLTDTIKTVSGIVKDLNGIVKDLFELEGRLSHIE